MSPLGCTAVQRVPKDEPKAFLTMRVEPKSAEIYVDGEYKGTVEGWVEGAVPMAPGEHRVKLTADGYITRRFDVELEPGESKILELDMERRLETFSRDTGTESPPPGRPKSPLGSESSLPGKRGAPDASGGETSE